MIRVFIVEDSPTVRRHLQSVFMQAGDFQVVGTASTVAGAVDAIPGVRPDLVTLDVFLPEGGTAADVVRKLASVATMPIVLLSEAPRTSTEVFEALEAGALDFIRKPKPGDQTSTATLLNALRALSRVQRNAPPPPVFVPSPSQSPFGVLAIASSTGGPSALREILQNIPSAFPLPIVIAQHLAEGFEEGLIRWLAQVCSLKFVAVTNLERLHAGTVYLGKSGADLVIKSVDEVQVAKAPPRGYHPSGDVLFESAARAFGAQAIAVVLSGIGSDGAQGAKTLANLGGLVLGQSAQSSVVYGMPKAAAEIGACSYVGTPKELALAILRSVGSMTAGRRRG
jgi:two-component system chemotaxis response regulator CheB